MIFAPLLYIHLVRFFRVCLECLEYWYEALVGADEVGAASVLAQVETRLKIAPVEPRALHDQNLGELEVALSDRICQRRV